MSDVANRVPAAFAATLADRKVARQRFEEAQPTRTEFHGLIAEGPVERLVEDHRSGKLSVEAATYWYDRRSGRCVAIETRHGIEWLRRRPCDPLPPMPVGKADGFLRRWPRGSRPAAPGAVRRQP